MICYEVSRSLRSCGTLTVSITTSTSWFPTAVYRNLVRIFFRSGAKSCQCAPRKSWQCKRMGARRKFFFREHDNEWCFWLNIDTQQCVVWINIHCSSTETIGHVGTMFLLESVETDVSRPARISATGKMPTQEKPDRDRLWTWYHVLRVFIEGTRGASIGRLFPREMNITSVSE